MEQQTIPGRGSVINPQQALPDQAETTSHTPAAGTKKSFLVYTHNKYIVVPVETIALFLVKYDTTIIVSFDGQQYFINYSLEQVQHLVAGNQFYRLNRQYLINVNAIKEVEHYFARKLLVTASIPFKDKLIVSKERARHFLDWLEAR